MKKKKFLRMGIVVLVCMILLSGVATATDGFKNIRVQYKNIKVMVNNAFKASEDEPFIFNDRTYVPLRFVSEALGADVNWNGTTNTVSINLSTADVAELEALKAQLTQKDYQIIMLQNELDTYKKEAEKETKVEKRLEDLEEKLMKDFDELRNVDIDSIKLEGDEDEIEVLIEVNLTRRNLDAWADLTDRQIEKWIGDLVGDIQSEFSRNTEVIGDIYDKRERDNIVEFDKYGRDSLEVDFWDDDYRKTTSSISDVESDLRGMDWRIDSNDFVIDYVKYDRDDVTVELVYDGKSFSQSDWDKLRNIEDDIEALCREIVYEFEDNADASPKRIYLKVYDSNWKSLDEFEFIVRTWSLR